MLPNREKVGQWEKILDLIIHLGMILEENKFFRHTWNWDSALSVQNQPLALHELRFKKKKKVFWIKLPNSLLTLKINRLYGSAKDTNLKIFYASSVEGSVLSVSRVFCLFCSCFRFFFFMWTIFKVFIEFLTILLLFSVLVFLDLSSLTRDWILSPRIRRWSLKHWPTREVPVSSFSAVRHFSRGLFKDKMNTSTSKGVYSINMCPRPNWSQNQRGNMVAEKEWPFKPNKPWVTS